MKQRRIAVVLAGSLIAVGLGASASPTAHADGGRRAVSPTRQRDAVAYWTPERMRNAQQVAVKRPAGQQPPTRVKVGTERIIRAASLDSRSSRTTIGHRWAEGGKVARTTGKIFFTIPLGEPSPGDYVCSGSVAPANNKSIIITAGHCVNDANDHQQAGDGRRGQYVTNWVFIPGYDGSSLLDPTPYGVFPATTLRAPKRWVKRADFSYDVGFATVGAEIGGRHPGALIANAVGSQGLGFNLARHRYVDNFGYPADPPFDGRQLAYSAGPALNADANGPKPGNSVRKDDPLGSNAQVVQSDLTGGSSGGPWFYDFNQAKGTGTQVSVNSFSYLGLTPKQRKELQIPKDNIWGPYFGAAIERLFDSVQGPPPQAASQSVSTPEDKPVKIILSGTKSVPNDPRPLQFTIIKQPAHGKLTQDNADVSYTPDRNFNGHDSFRFVAGNGINTSAPATVRVNVTPVNDPPTVAALDARTRWNEPVDITLKGHDPDSNNLTYALADPPSDGGRVMIKGDIATYTPAGTTGSSTADTVTFSYLASDGQATSKPATVHVTVVPNSLPVAHADSYSVAAGQQLTVPAPGVLKNDTDADGDTLSAIAVGKLPDGLIFNADGSFSYAAPMVYQDRTISFSYRATDGVQAPTGGSASLNRQPAKPKPLAYSKDVTVTISVAAATRPSPKPTPPPSAKPKPSPKPSAPNRSKPPASNPATAAPSASQPPDGPLGDTGSPFSATLIGFGLLTLAAGVGTLIAARRRTE